MDMYGHIVVPKHSSFCCVIIDLIKCILLCNHRFNEMFVCQGTVGINFSHYFEIFIILSFLFSKACARFSFLILWSIWSWSMVGDETCLMNVGISEIYHSLRNTQVNYKILEYVAVPSKSEKRYFLLLNPCLSLSWPSLSHKWEVHLFSNLVYVLRIFSCLK